MKVLFSKLMKNIIRTSNEHHFFFFPIFPDKTRTVSMIDVESVKQPSNRWLLISIPAPPLSLVITLSLVIAFSLNFYCTVWRQFLTPKYFPPTITRHLGLKPTPSPCLVRVYTRHYMHQREIWFLGWAREKYNKSSR